MTDEILELFENGICIKCGGDDVECLEDCTEHKCIDCEYIPEQDMWSSLPDLSNTLHWGCR